MDAIKKKMCSLAAETEWATKKAEKFEEEARRAGEAADKTEEHVRNLQKKIQSIEGQFDVCAEDLFNASIKLEEKEKVCSNAEGDVGALARRILLLEDEVERSEERLAKAVRSLCSESMRADNSVKKRIQLELNQSSTNEQFDSVEGQLKEARFMLGESERKFEDISRKFGTMESELMHATERAENQENKIIDLEEELKVVGNNLQQLEVSEEKALQREESYQKQIHDLMERLKATETRAENAEMNIQRLNIRIDQIEDDLISEKLKIKRVSDDLNSTFNDMMCV